MVCLELRDTHTYEQRKLLESERTHISYVFEEADGGPRDSFPRGEHICPSEPVRGELNLTFAHTNFICNNRTAVHLCDAGSGGPSIWDETVVDKWFAAIKVKFPDGGECTQKPDDCSRVLTPVHMCSCGRRRAR